MKYVPLGRGCQGNAATPLQPLRPVERKAATVFQQPNHASHAVVILAITGGLGKVGVKNLAAQVATQLLQTKDLGLQWRLPHESHQYAGLLVVQRSLMAGLQNSNLPCHRVIARPTSAVTIDPNQCKSDLRYNAITT
jgi:hypothetical protein